jgi:hypothetical protein
MRSAFVALALVVAAGCGDRQLKAAGAPCVATSECEEGLTCDFGQSPAVCAGGQSGGGEADAAVTPPDGGQVPPVDGALPPPADAGIDAP